MTISQLYELDGVTISGTEISIVTGTTYASGSVSTTPCVAQCEIDTSTVAKGDEFEVKFYDKTEGTGGSVRLVQNWRLMGVQATNLFIPAMIVLYGWDFTIKKIGGTDRAFDASIRCIT